MQLVNQIFQQSKRCDQDSGVLGGHINHYTNSAAVSAQLEPLARIDSRHIGPGLIWKDQTGSKRVSMGWTTKQ